MPTFAISVTRLMAKSCSLEKPTSQVAKNWRKMASQLRKLADVTDADAQGELLKLAKACDELAADFEKFGTLGRDPHRRAAIWS